MGIVACGGASNPADVKLSVDGTAATGAPLAGATLQIYGSDGAAYLATPVTVAADGSYAATISGRINYPLVFVVDDGTQKLISVKAAPADSETGNPTVNVTQLTNLIAARLSPSGDPGNLVNEIASGTVVTAAKVSAVVADVNTAIAPLLAAHGLAAGDPISTRFVANGTGYDKFLDTIDVAIEPKGNGSAIELTVKQSVDEQAGDLPKISMSNSGTIPALASSISKANLPVDGLTPQLKSLLDQATACYAVAKADRVSGNNAADIKAAACKDMFFGSNPANYKRGGHIVKSTDDFSGIFSATVPVTFSAPRYYFTVAADTPGGPKAGDVVFGYRWVDEFGNFQYEKNVVRKDTDGKYRFIGNQYAYPGGTSAYAQRRNFLMQPESTYLSVGYVFDVPCISGASGNTTWKKVVITAPSGKSLTLVPNVKSGTTTCNYSYFTVPVNNAPSGTGYIRIRSEYENAASAPAKHPRELDTDLAFVGTDFTEAEIEAIPQFGRWQYDYFFDAASVTNNKPSATQYFRTVSRASTIANFRQSVKLPALDAAYSAALVTEAGKNCSATGCYVVPSNPFNVKWTVSAAAKGMPEPPATYRVRIYGKYGSSGNSRTGYEDTNDVRSTFRSTDIKCGNGDTSQLQCETKSGSLVFAVPSGQRGYNFATTVGNIDLVSRLSNGSDASHFHTLSKF